MTIVKSGIIALAAVVLLSGPAGAQERNQFGLNFGVQTGTLFSGGSTTTIGATYHVSDRVAVRPAFRFSKIRTRPEQFSTSFGTFPEPEYEIEIKQTSWALGASVLFYLTREERLSTYLAASFDYASETRTTETKITSGYSVASLVIGFPSNPFDLSERAEHSGKVGGGTFGVQYAISKHLSLYGEVGFLYESVAREGGGDYYKRAASLNSGLGVIFYLNSKK